MNKMIKTLGLLGIFAVLLTAFTACSKDDDPADNDLFIGKYEGTISFTNLDDDTKNVSSTEGTVTVTKIGNDYNFAFSNGIENINGVKFEKNENVLVNVGSTESALIRINAGKLTIAFTKDNKIWTADADRK